MTYVDKNRLGDMQQAALFRDTLRKDVDDRIKDLLRTGCGHNECARVMCVSDGRVRRCARELHQAAKS